MIQLKALVILVCLVHLVKPMVVNDIESGGSSLTKIFDQNQQTVSWNFNEAKNMIEFKRSGLR